MEDERLANAMRQPQRQARRLGRMQFHRFVGLTLTVVVRGGLGDRIEAAGGANGEGIFVICPADSVTVARQID